METAREILQFLHTFKQIFIDQYEFAVKEYL